MPEPIRLFFEIVGMITTGLVAIAAVIVWVARLGDEP